MKFLYQPHYSGLGGNACNNACNNGNEQLGFRLGAIILSTCAKPSSAMANVGAAGICGMHRTPFHSAKPHCCPLPRPAPKPAFQVWIVFLQATFPKKKWHLRPSQYSPPSLKQPRNFAGPTLINGESWTGVKSSLGKKPQSRPIGKTRRGKR